MPHCRPVAVGAKRRREPGKLDGDQQDCLLPPERREASMPWKWVTAGIAHKRSPNLEPRVVQYLKRNGQVVEHSGSCEAHPGRADTAGRADVFGEGRAAEAAKGKGA
ncbi:hypothetical protein GCM10009736_29260 [Actinomadura bangladeshensis]